MGLWKYVRYNREHLTFETKDVELNLFVITDFDYLVQCFSNFSGAQSPYNILALRESQTMVITGLVNNPNT
jgi:hypothetical protein